ncbi:Gfo/Idh/MocA family protein [Propionibacteriaceae bacterium Y2011]|uniref:Gfo/Idh/MocA family protein n=1 Tax=Microlunatus sp. Y2014 TaxID=3418488 RepID=UPI003B461094
MARGPVTSATLRVGVLGAGTWAPMHLAALATLPDVEVVGIADRDVDRAAAVAGSYGIGTYVDDAVGLLDRLRPDAVVIVTPSPTHQPFAQACAERGIAALVEKPVCRVGEEQALLAAAEQVIMMPGHVLRFCEPYVRVADLAAQEWGPVLGLSAQRHRERGHVTSYPETHIVDLTMVHDIDLSLWLLGSGADSGTGGRVVEVSATTALPTAAAPSLTPGAPPALAQAELRTADGRVALLRSSFLLPEGAEGRDLLVATGRGGTETVASTDVDLAAGTAAEWRHFLDAVRSGRPPTRVTIADAVAGLQVAAAIKASAARDGEPVSVPG